MNINGGALTGPADHRHNTRTLDRITGISAARANFVAIAASHYPRSRLSLRGRQR